MSTVVILGFSTAGKSSIIRYLKKNCKGKIKTIDTDYEIAKDFDCHIYNVFFEKVNDNNDRKEALDFIEKREREILANLSVKTDSPRLIATGPFLPCREPQWSNFVENVRPICFYLELNPNEVYKGLMKRRRRHIFKDHIYCRKYFGSWDYDVTTKYKNSGKYVLLPKKIAVQNIEKLMKGPVEIYNKYCNGKKYSARALQKNENLKINFYNEIKEYFFGKF